MEVVTYGFKEGLDGLLKECKRPPKQRERQRQRQGKKREEEEEEGKEREKETCLLSSGKPNPQNKKPSKQKPS